jgi:hypothetical protein
MSSNLFQDIMKDLATVEQEMLGPDYQYYKYINTPGEMGMSADGNLPTLEKDVQGLISYVELLVQGNGNASKTGQPLGNKFFMKTGAKCMAPDNSEQDRYIYINNVPNGNIPFISAGLGVDFTEFRGLIPGAMEDLNTLSPYGIMQAFMSGPTPPCEKITMETIDVNNNKSIESQYVIVNDIKRMDGCDFNVPPMQGKSSGVNPLTGVPCRQGFQNQTTQFSPVSYGTRDEAFPRDPIHQMYFICLSVLGILFLYKIAEK